MAEGMFGSLLGGEDEAAEIEATAEQLAGADAYAIAMAVEQARHDPKVAAATVVFLEMQARLLEAQADQIDGEEPVRLHHLHGQSREARLRRVGQWIRLATQILITVIFALLGFGAALMLHDAATSRAVVVAAFDAPPALAPAGISGKVVATEVLDALQVLADTNRSVEKSLASQSAWASEVQIEVPETGVSIGEVDRLLHERFGHDLHVSGSLIQAADGGLTLTVRGDGLTPKSFSGAAGDLTKLATRAAEYVYGSSQPHTFATYLNQHGRNAEALAFLPGAFAAADTNASRSKLANSWGNAFAYQNKQAQAAEKYRLAIALNPHNWNARTNLPSTLLTTEGEESAWRASADSLRAASAATDHGPEMRLLGNLAVKVWDLPLSLEAALADAAYNRGAGASSVLDGPQLADTYALMHDFASAERYMAASDPDDFATKAEALLLPAYAALDRGDGAAAVPPLETFWASWQGSPELQDASWDYPCLLGLAYGLSGRLADAEAVFEKTGKWNRCFAFHGYALALAGDVANAERVWADGQRLTPDMPFVPLYRGLSEAARGLDVSAAADFAAAHRAAPHFAEPLKAWGDLLAREGQKKDAQDKYTEALRYAPAWDALKQAATAAKD